MAPLEIQSLEQLEQLPETGGERWLASQMLQLQLQYMAEGRLLKVIYAPGTYADPKSGKVTRPDLAMIEDKPDDVDDPPVQLITDVTDSKKIDKHKQWLAMQDWLLRHPSGAYLQVSTALGDDVRCFLGSVFDNPWSHKRVQQTIYDLLNRHA